MVPPSSNRTPDMVQRAHRWDESEIVKEKHTHLDDLPPPSFSSYNGNSDLGPSRNSLAGRGSFESLRTFMQARNSLSPAGNLRSTLIAPRGYSHFTLPAVHRK